jgi:hypothetical protein
LGATASATSSERRSVPEADEQKARSRTSRSRSLAQVASTWRTSGVVRASA